MKMLIFRAYAFLVLFFLVSFQSVFATDYYCDPVNGDNNNKGTKENPWRSLESVFKESRSYEPGDRIYLMTGDHGDVLITGENAKYIKIIGLEGQNPVIRSLSFGSETLKASRW